MFSCLKNLLPTARDGDFSFSEWSDVIFHVIFTDTYLDDFIVVMFSCLDDEIQVNEKAGGHR